jgi:hypothetical protein
MDHEDLGAAGQIRNWCEIFFCIKRHLCVHVGIHRHDTPGSHQNRIAIGWGFRYRICPDISACTTTVFNHNWLAPGGR